MERKEGVKEKERQWLVGETIQLRPMEMEDTDRIVRWRNQEFVRKNFIYRGAFTREGHERWIKEMVETGRVVQFIICEKAGNRPVGSVYLRDIDPVYHKAEYGVFIGEREALGKGYGTQAAKLMVRYAFEQMGLHKVMLRVLAENMQARRSYEKAGFVQEAYLKEEVFLEGAYRDVIYMAVLNPDKREKGGFS